MKISIITVNYNNKSGLIKTIDSVLSQKYADFEYIVIDGDSIDGSKEIINSYGDNIISISEKDTGIYNAMNKGVRMAQGEYCIFMNSGDIFKDEYVLKDICCMLDKDIIVGIGQWGNTHKYIYPPKERELSLSFFLRSALHHQSVFIKRNLLISIPYSEKYKISSDTIFFFKSIILENCTYKDIDRIIAISEAAGISSNLKNSLQERFAGIKECLPERLNKDIDYLIESNKFYNRCLYNFINNRAMRWILTNIKK